MLSAEDLIQKTIEISGSNKLKNAKLEFDFRDTHFKAVRQNGRFALEREFQADQGEVRDLLTNEGFVRFVNAEKVMLIDSMATAYAASVNSVHYFAVLPYDLDAASVNKELLQDVTIKDALYHTVKVTFNESGGGEDFDDEYLYWINTETFKIDYLAYSYEEEDGLGYRFREAYNERFVEGVRFVDYNNYKPKSNTMSLSDMPKLFNNGELELLSKIETENVRFTLL
ncbi:deoxyribose-phosphate aldolase [Subsaximicrobium wynnwilliamsii]|uniref:Deoxyribose-phosphate aldolase n=2 Tax=Subsaximicrobium wynnwilliamsii TaxID=291179 RepID=A0A5C6ZM03_9FLAO|nr:deoxyribose-phosphate aldolase [Subsaximicrobium wynnwilliamsii]TXD91334.1 deoxyribose-phosphate aldolase [Subsaximicrobium wynnwilliamsii]TXE04727.1 deoxyribose-phosphate aldolase [Subsaximicrobium wynnwilliamsii]